MQPLYQDIADPIEEEGSPNTCAPRNELIRAQRFAHNADILISLIQSSLEIYTTDPNIDIELASQIIQQYTADIYDKNDALPVTAAESIKAFLSMGVIAHYMHINKNMDIEEKQRLYSISHNCRMAHIAFRISAFTTALGMLNPVLRTHIMFMYRICDRFCNIDYKIINAVQSESHDEYPSEAVALLCKFNRAMHALHALSEKTFFNNQRVSRQQDVALLSVVRQSKHIATLWLIDIQQYRLMLQGI